MVVTKADVYEQVIHTERPVCPHCGQQMSIWECVDTGLSCGSGWGTPYLFICANDACPLFVSGLKAMKANYGRTCSCRCIHLPGSRGTETMVVFSFGVCQEGLLDENAVAADRLRGTNRDPAVLELMACFKRKNLAALQTSLFDDTIYWKVRMRAADLIGELGILDALETMQSTKFRDNRVGDAVRAAIQKIHEINATQECPHCKEIIEAKAKICTQCGRRLT